MLQGLLLLGFSAEIQPQTKVYRCVGESGEVEFRQTTCLPSRREQEELTIDNRPSGWVPPQPAAAPAPRGSRGGKTSRSDRAAGEERARKLADRCWKKRRQLDDVNWRLRRGYKPGAGVKLRRRRDDYEAYIDRFCDGLER
jgi:hypothetical protein